MGQGNFNINEYVENLKNINNKSKARFFLEYLKATKGNDILDIPDVFGILDKDFLLGSLEFYIYETSPARNSAADYRRTVMGLCKDVCNDYGIKNDFLENANEQEVFAKTAKEWIDRLRESESRECMLFDDFELLDDVIRDFFNTDNLEEQIIKSIERENHKPNYYARLVSAVALKLVQKYGLANKTVANLKVADVDLDDRIIEVNGFKLFIDEELASYFELYLKSRNFVISNNANNNCQTDFLFIKKNGASHLDKNGSSDNSSLFLLMNNALGSIETSGLRLRTIKELVSKGANIKLLHQLTDITTATIAEKCLDDDKTSLENLFSGVYDSNIGARRLHPKGQIRCPYCGDYKDACSENWVLIRVVGEEIKHLACRECNGRDGKYKY